jgi:F0F1-type ATP synthase assembly protein I
MASKENAISKIDGVDHEEGEFGVLNLAMDLGWVLVLPVLVGVGVGRWLDGKLGTLPDFTVGLLLLGVVLGFSAMIWKAKKATEGLGERGDSGKKTFKNKEDSRGSK